MTHTCTCQGCGIEFEPKHKKNSKYHSPECYRENGTKGARKEQVQGFRMKLARDHPLAPKSGLLGEHRIVLYAQIGPGEHPCHWCGTRLSWKTGRNSRDADAVFVDHLDHNPLNNAPENLVPSCNNCNAHRTKKGNRSRIKEGEDFVVLPNGSRTRAIRKVCLSCDEEFLMPPAWDRKRCQKCGGMLAYKTGQPKSLVERTCEMCSVTFFVPPSWVKEGTARFCSRSCARKWPHRNRIGLHSKWNT